MGWVGNLHVTIRAVLLAFSLLLVGLLFRELVTLLVAILITILFSIPLSAAATTLERYRIPRPVGALVALLAGLAAVGGTFALIIPPFVDQVEAFVDAVPGIVTTLEEQIRGVTGASSSEVGTTVQEFLQRFTDNPSELIGPLASIGIGIAGVLAGLVLIILTAFYIALAPGPLVEGALSLIPPTRRPWARSVMERLRTAWIGWMQGVIIDMLITGVLLYVGLTLIDVDFAIVFAVLSAFLVLIPYFGAIAGGIPPVLLALTDSPEKALAALLIYVGIQQIESNLTIPLVMAQRVRLHPALVAIGVVIVGQLFGFIGLFVAVPILSLIVIGVDELWVRPMERAPVGSEFESPEAAGAS